MQTDPMHHACAQDGVWFSNYLYIGVNTREGLDVQARIGFTRIPHVLHGNTYVLNTLNTYRRLALRSWENDANMVVPRS